MTEEERISNEYGSFAEDGSVYVIKDYKTPRPWLNYIWNDLFMSGINQTGGGNGSYGNRAASYIDPGGMGRANLLRNGNRYFYIKDEESGEYWNPGWYPVQKELDEYTCTHGLGYSKIEGSYDGITTGLRVFLNSEHPVEIWTVKLSNNSSRGRKIKVFSFIEFSLEGYERYSEYDSYVSTEYIKDKNMIIAYNNAQERPHQWYHGFVAADLQSTGFDSSKREFIGRYGFINSPAVVREGKCKDSLAACEDMVGVLEHSFNLEAGESREYNIIYGSADSRERAISFTEEIFSNNRIQNYFEELQTRKQQLIDKIEVDTPDQKINHMINNWTKQQVQLCAEVGRATGKGFRDQLQDAWAVAAFNQELASNKIIETLEHQYSDGRCVRGWMPLDQHIYSDGPTWIAPAINAYIKETGDIDFLNRPVKYLDKGKATVWEHILTAVRYSSDDLGEHNLVLAHDGDWNDSLNGIGVEGKGESIWTSIALYYALNNVAEMADELKNNTELAEEMFERAERIKEAVNNNAWDGEWYLAAYNDKGKKVGSSRETEGMVYLNSQTWALMSGLTDEIKKDLCLGIIDNKLDSEYGPLTLYPPYTEYRPEIGRLSGFIPGIWENGTPYCHGGAFKIVADCILGRGNKAYDSYKKIMPDSINNPSSYSGCEPYVFTNMYFGPDNPRAGETAFAWVTGTAGWMFRALTQYMLGFHPNYDSIKIKPCLPDSWGSCSLRREYRGDIYHLQIEVKGEDREKTNKITVDGKQIEGNKFKIFGDGQEHKILVEIAKPSYK